MSNLSYRREGFEQKFENKPLACVGRRIYYYFFRKKAAEYNLFCIYRCESLVHAAPIDSVGRPFWITKNWSCLTYPNPKKRTLLTIKKEKKKMPFVKSLGETRPKRGSVSRMISGLDWASRSCTTTAFQTTQIGVEKRVDKSFYLWMDWIVGMGCEALLVPLS